MKWKWLSKRALLGYAVSWAVFVILLTHFQDQFGNGWGLLANYFFSFVVWSAFFLVF
jgi:hypothetical protein